MFHPKGSELERDHLKSRNFDSVNSKVIFKRDAKTSQKERRMTIRKRSIKQSGKEGKEEGDLIEKKRNEGHINKLVR